ncbi:MAG: SPOR domain-containing protein [Ignavibacteriales bacterium]|nr:SPOR domain-containing protein [Ignavibacteriales bacterium]
MPNFNLKGDAGKPAAKQAGESPSTKSPGGAVKIIVIVLFAVVILGGAAFFLNKAGIIKLWGKKPVPQQVAVPQIEVADSAQMVMQADTSGLVDFKGNEEQKTKVEPAKKKQEKQQPPAKKEAPVLAPKQAAKPTVQPTRQSLAVSKNVPVGSGPYSIQMSSWASREKAEMEVVVLKQQGHPAFVQEAFVSGLGHRYRVNVGRFTSESAAQEEAKKIAGDSGFLIIRIGN